MKRNLESSHLPINKILGLKNRDGTMLHTIIYFILLLSSIKAFICTLKISLLQIPISDIHISPLLLSKKFTGKTHKKNKKKKNKIENLKVEIDMVLHRSKFGLYSSIDFIQFLPQSFSNNPLFSWCNCIHLCLQLLFLFPLIWKSYMLKFVVFLLFLARGFSF